MIWQVLEDPLQGCLSYLVGDEVTHEALVVDPLASVGMAAYVLAAQEAGLTIRRVVETHVHADHRSAARELAEALDVPLGLSHRAPARFSFDPLREGDVWRLGDVECQVWEAPGHTPDAIVVVVTDRRRGPEPWAVLTGDSLFVGDVGRPDLVDDNPETVRAALSEQYRTVARILSLPDFVEVHPAHYGASACGGLFMDRKPHSTVGYERRFNRVAALADEDAFITTVMRLLKPPPADAAVIRADNLGWREGAAV
jgi:hydroxyacylglutathione hydrolase